jgi:hypothetical protein
MKEANKTTTKKQNRIREHVKFQKGGPRLNIGSCDWLPKQSTQNLTKPEKLMLRKRRLKQDKVSAITIWSGKQFHMLMTLLQKKIYITSRTYRGFS